MKISKKLGFFAGGVLFGTAGLRILGSREAKKAYGCATAAVLRAKDDIMAAVTKVRENAGDVLADAKDRNEKRAAAAEVIDDCAEDAGCGCSDTDETSCCCSCADAAEAEE